MGERRRRKSLWDTEKETKCFSGMSNHNSWTEKECHSNNDSGHYNKLSASEIHTAAKSTDHSGQPSWKSIEENSAVSTNGSFMKSRQTAPEGMEISGRNRDYQDVSPGFDGQHKFSRTLETGRSHSRRYMGKVRSRSRSRSRTRGRSRSRSLSRGWRKERGRAQGRSRSSGSSRSDGSAKGRTRNHSPVGDYRHQSYAWSDRRSLPDKSSQICKDFAAGRCRRGSHCRFFHPKNVSCEDGDLMGDNAGESWCKRADYGQISKHSFRRGPGSGSDLRGDVSEPCHERQDKQFLSNSKTAVLCKDFMKGKCRLGDTCRLSHHFYSDETFGKGTRYASSDKDIEQEHVKNGKPLCKYFLVGKCDRDNCRFSHEDPKFNRLEGRQGEATNEGSLQDRSNLWKGPTWKDPTRISDNVKHGGWSETTTAVVNLASDMTNAKNDNRWGHSLENENSGCGIPEWTDNSINQDKEPPLPAGIGGYGRDAGTAESTGKENMAYREEHHTLHGSQLQNQDGHHTLQEDPSFSMKAWLQNVSAISQIQQQHHGVVENDLLSSFQSNVIDAATNSSSATQPIIFSGQNLNKNDENVFQGDSSISNETDGRKNVHRRNPPNECSCSLNGPETHLAAPFSLQAQLQNHMKAFQMSETLEGKAPLVFPNLSSTEQASELTNSTTAFAGEHVTPVAVAVNMIPFSDTLVNVSHVNANITQSDPVKVSRDPIDPMDSGRGMNEHGSHKEQDNEMKVGKSSPLSIVDSKPDNSIVDHSGSPKLKQETVLASSEVDAVNRVIGNESKGIQNNKHSQTLDGHGKDGESGANKDDKGMRLFKNSLIEFVKDILKPTWKEGQMSREVHKSIVKKVVDKVTSTIQTDHIPKTQDKVNQYLSYSKPKIAKLVQAYVGRSVKTHS